MRISALTLGLAAALLTACAGPGESRKASDSRSFGAPVEQDGYIYTPVSQGSQGCLLYNLRIPGGQAPAALAYRSEDGHFSYDRPERCVRSEKR